MIERETRREFFVLAGASEDMEIHRLAKSGAWKSIKTKATKGMKSTKKAVKSAKKSVKKGWKSAKESAKNWAYIPSVERASARIQKYTQALTKTKKTNGPSSPETTHAKAMLDWAKSELALAKAYAAAKAAKNKEKMQSLRKSALQLRDKWFSKLDDLEDKMDGSAKAEETPKAASTRLTAAVRSLESLR